MAKRNDNRQAQKPTTTNKIHRDTNLTHKTDAKTGYKHGSMNNRKKAI